MGLGWSYAYPPRPAVNQRVVVVTGCDTGFGHLTALKLDLLGYQVVALCLTDKGIAELQGKASNRVVVRKVDVTKKEDIQTVANEIAQRYPDGIYGLVNNAGVGHGGPVEWVPMETFKFVMDVNFFGYVAMVKSLAPLLRKGYGRVINIASVAGFLPATGMAAYSASKHAVEAFTDCLRMEMAPFGVAVTCIEPFFMKTNIIQGIDVQLSKLYDSLPQNEKDVWGDHLAKKLGATSALINAIAGEPGEVVDCIVHALQSSWPKTRYTPAPFVLKLTRFAPTFLLDFISYMTSPASPAQAYLWLKAGDKPKSN